MEVVIVLDVANKYQDQIKELDIDTWYDEKYKYYHAAHWHSEREFANNDWDNRIFVSLDKDKNIVGLIGYHINQPNDCVDCLYILNYTGNKIVFGIDLGIVLDEIFTKYNFRKLMFTVIVGNPIEKSYDKLVHKYGGRIVGTYKQNVKLIDNQYYDEKMYEIFRSDYLQNKKVKVT